MAVGHARVGLGQGVAEAQPPGDEEDHQRAGQVTAHENRDPARHRGQQRIEEEHLRQRQELPQVRDGPGKRGEQEEGESPGKERQGLARGRDVRRRLEPAAAHRRALPQLLHGLEIERLEAAVRVVGAVRVDRHCRQQHPEDHVPRDVRAVAHDERDDRRRGHRQEDVFPELHHHQHRRGEEEEGREAQAFLQRHRLAADEQDEEHHPAVTDVQRRPQDERGKERGVGRGAQGDGRAVGHAEGHVVGEAHADRAHDRVHQLGHDGPGAEHEVERGDDVVIGLGPALEQLPRVDERVPRPVAREPRRERVVGLLVGGEEVVRREGVQHDRDQDANDERPSQQADQSLAVDGSGGGGGSECQARRGYHQPSARATARAARRGRSPASPSARHAAAHSQSRGPRRWAATTPAARAYTSGS